MITPAATLRPLLPLAVFLIKSTHRNRSVKKWAVPPAERSAVLQREKKEREVTQQSSYMSYGRHHHRHHCQHPKGQEGRRKRNLKTFRRKRVKRESRACPNGLIRPTNSPVPESIQQVNRQFPFCGRPSTCASSIFLLKKIRVYG